jgi:hypothetical protein
LFVLSFSLAVFVAGLAPPLDATSVQVFSVLAVVFALLLVGYSTWLVRVWRRQLVKRWEDGLPLPRGTSEASIRAWATAHGRDRGAPGCVG